jgi:hypothetical protein
MRESSYKLIFKILLRKEMHVYLLHFCILACRSRWVASCCNRHSPVCKIVTICLLLSLNDSQERKGHLANSFIDKRVHSPSK